MEVIAFVFGLAGLAFALMAFNQVNELKKEVRRIGNLVEDDQGSG